MIVDKRFSDFDMLWLGISWKGPVSEGAISMLISDKRFNIRLKISEVLLQYLHSELRMRTRVVRNFVNTFLYNNRQIMFRALAVT